MYWNISPEWEEQELRELQEREAAAMAKGEGDSVGEQIGRMIDMAEREQHGETESLNMSVPSWWNSWQAFLSELQRTGRSTYTVDDVQIVYERAWSDAVKTIEAAIRNANQPIGTCATCGRAFPVVDARQRFCDDRCSSRSRYVRKVARETVEAAIKAAPRER